MNRNTVKDRTQTPATHTAEIVREYGPFADRIHAYAHPDLASAKAGDLTSYLELITRDKLK